MPLSPNQLSWKLREAAQLHCILKPEAYPLHTTGVHLGGVTLQNIPNDSITLLHTFDGTLGVHTPPNKALMYSYSGNSLEIQRTIARFHERRSTRDHYFYERLPPSTSHALVHVMTPAFQIPASQVKDKVRDILQHLFQMADEKQFGIMSIPPLGMGLLGYLDPPEAAGILVEGLTAYWKGHPAGGTTFLISVEPDCWFPQDRFPSLIDGDNCEWTYDLFAYEAVLNAMLTTVTSLDNVITRPDKALCLGFHHVTGPSFFE